MFHPKIIIFGSNGMLGRYLTSFLKQKNYHVIPLTRKDFNVFEYFGENSFKNLESYLNKLNLNETTVVINCIGLIPQSGNLEQMDYIYINSIFPSKLADICNKNNTILIHPTTDCVFNGRSNYPYDESSIRNENNIYGISKQLGENIDATIIRTSIIGEELDHHYSLLEITKSHKDKKMFGYTDHIWNGITCLQFAKLIDYMIEHDIFWKGIRHIFSPKPLTKFDIIRYINMYYHLNIDLQQKRTEYINKTLTTKYTYHDTYQLHNLNNYIPDLETQIKELAKFKLI